MRGFSSNLKAACLLLSLATAAVAAPATLDTTTTTITSLVPPSPITLGSATTVSVTVAGSGGGTPTGSVTVSDGTGASCPITLASGSGSCDLTPSSPGTKSVTAQYAGDASFMGSTSVASSLVVTPPARTITSSGSSNGSISPPSQYVTDGNTAAFDVMPHDGYAVTIGGTCPAGTLSHGTYTTGAISGDCAVTASFVSAETALSLQVTDDHLYARYGNSVDYTVTVSNSIGVNVTGLAISAAVSADLDTASTQWTCFGSNTQCQQQGTGLFMDSAVTIPGKSSVSWLIMLPVLPNAPDATVDYTISLDNPAFTGPITKTDSDATVIFHDSFEVPYGDGAQ